MLSNDDRSRRAHSRQPWMQVAKVGIAAVLIGLILWEVAPNRLLPTLLRARAGPVLFAMGLTVALNLVKPLRWQTIVRAACAGFGYVDALRSLLVAGSARLVLPGKLGEYGRLLTLRGIPVGTGIGMTTLDLLIEVQVGLMLAVPAVWLLVGPAAALLPLALAALAMAATRKTHATMSWIALVTRSRWLAARATELASATEGLRGGGQSWALALTLLLAGLRLLQLDVLLYSVGESHGVLTLLVMPLVQSADAIPLTLGGVGVREWVGLQLLPATGVAREAAVVAVALQSFITGAIPGLAGIPFLVADLRQRDRLRARTPSGAPP